jgi:proteasome assembly chaperone 4
MSVSATDEPKIKVSTHYFGATPTTPAIVIQVTHLDGSYMLWAGLTEADLEETAVQSIAQGRLTRAWACGMPPTNPSIPPGGTSIFQSQNVEPVLPMAMRLAKRFKKQMFLSVDIPISGGHEASLISLEIEKRLVETLKKLEQ